MRKLAGATFAVAVLALTSCVVEHPPAHILAEPDSTQPTAGICGDVEPGEIATFTLAVDTPQPRCGKVLAAQRLRVVNATSSRITVTFDGSDYELEPRAEQTFDLTFGGMWLPGVHLLHTSLYEGGGPEIWLVAD